MRSTAWRGVVDGDVVGKKERAEYLAPLSKKLNRITLNNTIRHQACRVLRNSRCVRPFVGRRSRGRLRIPANVPCLIFRSVGGNGDNSCLYHYSW